MRDGLLWTVLAAPVAYGRSGPPWQPVSVVLLVGLLSLLAAAVVGSRRWPLAGLVLVLLGTWFDGNVVFAVPVLSYLVGLRLTRARPAVSVFALVAAAGTVLNLALVGASLATWYLAATILLFGGVFPWLVGRYRRQRWDLVLAGWRQAEALERERRGADERVRLRERARIARDMHDSLGHELSLIALRAGALEMAADLDPRHRAAATELRVSVAAATERLREIIGVLRETPEPAPTRPVAGTVADLVAGARDAGVTVDLWFDGHPDTDVRPPVAAPEHRAVVPEPPAADQPPVVDPVAGLPPLVAGAVHRVVREGLTNAARYAPGAAVTVTVTRVGGELEVDVTNAAPPPGAPAGPLSTGSGLIALREGIGLLGGALHAGPRHDGGFAVTARLPVAAAAPAAGEAPVDPALVGAPVGAPVAVPEAVGGPDAMVGPLGGGAADRLRDARRRVRHSLLVAVTAPAVLAGVLSLVYYPAATVDAVLDRPAYDGMRIGQPRSELTGLPRRQVDEPSPAPPVPAGARCEYYTDGNFPLARPTYRLCFETGRLVAKDILNEDEEQP
ncbi:histidine kinase [Micromonospora zhanjiangensis]